MAETGKPASFDGSFRPALADDFAAISRLHALAFNSLAASHHTPRQLAAHAALTEAPEYAVDLGRSHLMLAVTAARQIVGSAGWIAVAEERSTARIRKVFVHPDFARRGLATGLVTDAEARAHAAGYTRLIVRANINAVPLYRKLGYRPLRDGVMATPDGVDLPVLFMAKAG